MTRERDSRAMRAAVTAQQMAEVDRRAVTCFEDSFLEMMENAGRALYLADIGVPAAAVAGMLESHDIATWFIADDVVRVA